MKISKQNIENLSDEELIKCIDQDRRLVQTVLYNRYEKLVYYKAISMLKDEHMAKDLTHDIFIKVFTSLAQFQGRSKFSLWVHSISFNTCVKYLNKKKKINIFDIDEEREESKDSSADDIDDKKQLELRLDFLQSFLQELKEEERYLILMKYIDGLTIREISVISQLKESTIKMKLKRTKAKLYLKYDSLNELG